MSVWQSLVFAFGLPWFFSLRVGAVPVYLDPESLFPTGHHNSDWLHKNLAGSTQQKWWHLTTNKGLNGWVPEHALRLNQPNKTNLTAHVSVSRLPVFSKASPNARVLGYLKRKDNVSLTKFVWRQWLYADIKKNRQWWIRDENITPGAAPKRITTAELFERTVFDMVRLKSGPQLASAKGLFRSKDGRTWERLPFFSDENYPLSEGRSGVLYVGPYRSDDGGDSFQPFVRWEHLVSSLKNSLRLTSPHIKLLEIKEQPDQSVELILDLGLTHPVRVSSKDGGQNWKTVASQ